MGVGQLLGWGVIQNFRGGGRGVWQKSSKPFLMHNFFFKFIIIIIIKNIKIIIM
jgi:hypothetical protein